MNWHTLWEIEDVKNTIIAIGILLVFLLLRRLFIKYIYKLILGLTSKSPTELFTQLLIASKKPLQWFFVIIGIYIAAAYFPYLDQDNKLFTNVIQSSIIMVIVWGLFNLTSATSLLFSRINRRGNVHLDEILIP